MIIAIQALLLLAAVFVRGWMLFGKQLKADKTNPSHLNYIAKNKYGNVIARYVGLTQTKGVPFVIQPERWYHRIFKAIGIAAELQVNRPDFDNRYFISTDFPHQLERAMQSGKALEHWLELFALPVHSLHALPDKIWCKIQKADREKDNAYFDQHRDILKAISQSTASTQDYPSASTSPRISRPIALGFICLHAGLLMAGLLAIPASFTDTTHLTDHHAWYITTAINGAIACVLWLAMILLLLRRTSWICWVLTDFALCGIAGIMLTSLEVTREANIRLPQPEARIQVQPITQRICKVECSQRCGKNCTHRSSYHYHTDAECTPEARVAAKHAHMQSDPICRSHAALAFELHVAHWDKAGDYSFTPSMKLFDQTHLGVRLVMPIHPGAQQLEWIDTEEIQPQ